MKYKLSTRISLLSNTIRTNFSVIKRNNGTLFFIYSKQVNSLIFRDIELEQVKFYSSIYSINATSSVQKLGLFSYFSYEILFERLECLHLEVTEISTNFPQAAKNYSIPNVRLPPFAVAFLSFGGVAVASGLAPKFLEYSGASRADTEKTNQWVRES